MSDRLCVVWSLEATSFISNSNDKELYEVEHDGDDCRVEEKNSMLEKNKIYFSPTSSQISTLLIPISVCYNSGVTQCYNYLMTM